METLILRDTKGKNYKNFHLIKKGDRIWSTSDVSFCSGGDIYDTPDTVTGVTDKYIKVKGGKYNRRTGQTVPQSHYSIGYWKPSKK